MRIVFAGTPDFAATALKRLHACGEHDIAAVYTQPDRRKGRGRKDPGVSPVKAYATEHGLEVEQPSAWDDDAVSRLRDYRADCMVVAAYGALLPPAVLSAPSIACVNIHFSLLPRWRGASPVARAVLAGDTETGVSLMHMDEGLDTGASIASRARPIDADATTASLYPTLTEMGAEMVLDFLREPKSHLAQARAQNEKHACYAHRLTKDEASVSWSQDAEAIDRLIRALNPWPVARTRLDGDDILLWEAAVVDRDARAERAPGEVLAADAQGIRVQCGRGHLEIRRLQVAGRRVLSARDFINGRPDRLRGRIQLA